MADRTQDEQHQSDHDRLENEIAFRSPHQENDRRDRARSGNKRDGQWKNGDVGTVFRLVGLGGRHRANAALSCKDHVNREQEQQKAAGNTESRQADAKKAEDYVSGESQHDQRDCRRRNRSYRSATPLLVRLPVRKRHE